jgi:hypothetical protein
MPPPFMSHKQSKLERRDHQAVAKLPPTTPSRSEGFIARTWKRILSGLTVLGAVGVVALWPRASMTFDATLNPAKPFATPFVFKNDAYETFRDIQFSCGVNDFETATGHPVFTTQGLGLTATGLGDLALRPDETTEMFCPIGDMFEVVEPATKLDIDIFVSFTVNEHISKRFTRCFRFITEPDSEGHLRWIEKGFAKKCEWPGSSLIYRGKLSN